ncbi:MAG: hypothetical protein JXB29_09640 [Sedimentisphaerales bacterium]|nr:hypothetical protein [Sedimentisphaerales bacterium]
MDEFSERRRESRLRYHWPIWFAEDFNDVLSQGQMIDISSEAAAFTCGADENCSYPGQEMTSRFSVPRFGLGDAFDMASFTRSGKIIRVDEVNKFLQRIAVQFAEPLPFKPGEQTDSNEETQQRLSAVTI